MSAGISCARRVFQAVCRYTYRDFGIRLHNTLHSCQREFGSLEVLLNGFCNLELVLPESFGYMKRGFPSVQSSQCTPGQINASMNIASILTKLLRGGILSGNVLHHLRLFDVLCQTRRGVCVAAPARLSPPSTVCCQGSTTALLAGLARIDSFRLSHVEDYKAAVLSLTRCGGWLVETRSAHNGEEPVFCSSLPFSTDISELTGQIASRRHWSLTSGSANWLSCPSVQCWLPCLYRWPNRIPKKLIGPWELFADCLEA